MEELAAEWERKAAEAEERKSFFVATVYLMCASELRQRLAADATAADVPAAVVVVVHEPPFVAEDGLRGRWDRPFNADEVRDNIRKLAASGGHYGEWYAEPVTRCCNKPESKCRCSKEVFESANRRRAEPIPMYGVDDWRPGESEADWMRRISGRGKPVSPEDAPAEPFSESGI